jgi:hypothetical protein
LKARQTAAAGAAWVSIIERDQTPDDANQHQQ